MPSRSERAREYQRAKGPCAYDHQWRLVRIGQLKREPLCRFCAAKGLVVAAQCVDHIIPLSVRPELRLVLSNLRSLCTPCHNAHTASGAWRSRLLD
jgi:5-methylcytosine-specific restriction endonuclease McrA